MNKLLLLLPFLSLAQETCTISSKSIFTIEDHPDLEVYAILDSSKQKVFSGTLAYPLIISQEENVNPNSTITHKYLIQAKDQTTFEVTENIRLKGCNIEFVNTLSPNLEARADWGPNKSVVLYSLITPKAKPKPLPFFGHDKEN